jgi:hypothetical protein
MCTLSRYFVIKKCKNLAIVNKLSKALKILHYPAVFTSNIDKRLWLPTKISAASSQSKKSQITSRSQNELFTVWPQGGSCLPSRSGGVGGSHGRKLTCGSRPSRVYLRADPMVERYKLSFTTGGLFLRESRDLASHYLNSNSWVETRNAVRSQNILQVRTDAAALRLSREIITRLETLNNDEIAYMTECSAIDLSCMLWLATCRRYQFIREFAVEVLREHFVVMKRQITYADFEAFYNSKALWHEELDQVSKSTQDKLRQNLFRMMRDAGFISDQNTIQMAMPTPAFIQLIAQRGLEELLIFPVSDTEMKRWIP